MGIHLYLTVCSCIRDIMRALVLVVLLSVFCGVFGYGHRHRRGHKYKKDGPRCGVQAYTVQDHQYKTECHEVYESHCETVYNEVCNTVTDYTEECHHHYADSHYVAPQEHHQCVQVPHHRQVCHKEPLQKCHKVPRQECRKIPVSVPRTVARRVCYGKY